MAFDNLKKLLGGDDQDINFPDDASYPPVPNQLINPKTIGQPQSLNLSPSQKSLASLLDSSGVGDTAPTDNDSIRESTLPENLAFPFAESAARGAVKSAPMALSALKDMANPETFGRLAGNEVGTVGKQPKDLSQILGMLNYPVSINGAESPLHATIKSFNPSEVSPDMAHEAVSKLNFSKLDPSNIGIEPSILQDRNGNDLHVLNLKANGIKDLHDQLGSLGKDSFNGDFQPHITVDKDLWQAIKNSGAKNAEDAGLSFGSPTMKVGDNTLQTYPTKLDMSPEARMQRARDMGFDTDKTYYHGTSADIQQFDPSKSEGSSGVIPDGSDGYSFFTNKPKVANLFAENSIKSPEMDRDMQLNDPDFWEPFREKIKQKLENKYPGRDITDHQLNDELERIDRDSPWISEKWANEQIGEPKVSNNQGTVYPTHLKYGNQHVVKPIKGEMPLQTIERGFSEAQNKEALENSNVDSILFKGIKDAPGFQDKSDVVAVKNPNQIRSKFAAFDPSKAGSGNIAAGLATLLGAGTTQLPQSEEDKWNQIRSLLGAK